MGPAVGARRDPTQPNPPGQCSSTCTSASTTAPTPRAVCAPPTPPFGPPPPRTQISLWERMKFTEGIIGLGHFWYTNFWVPDPPPSLSDTPLPTPSAAPPLPPAFPPPPVPAPRAPATALALTHSTTTTTAACPKPTPNGRLRTARRPCPTSRGTPARFSRQVKCRVQNPKIAMPLLAKQQQLLQVMHKLVVCPAPSVSCPWTPGPDMPLAYALEGDGPHRCAPP